MKSLILDKWDLNQKLKRLAYEILEDQYEEDEVCLIGIMKGGSKLACLLKEEIQKVSAIKVSTHSLLINKENPLSDQQELSEKIDYFNGKSLILVDDVANSGRTIFYAFQQFLRIEPKTLKVAVLIDRKHKKFPVNCDYVGKSLATTIKEHIEVVFDEEGVEAAYLV